MTAMPDRRTFFIWNHIKRPVMPQPTMETNMASTASAQNQRASTLEGYSRAR